MTKTEVLIELRMKANSCRQEMINLPFGSTAYKAVAKLYERTMAKINELNQTPV